MMINLLLMISILIFPARILFASEIATVVNQTIETPSVAVEPVVEILQAPSKDLRFVDPKAKEKEKAWKYSKEKDHSKWKYNDEIKRQLSKEKKTLKSIAYEKERLSGVKVDESKTYKTKVKKKDLEFKPSDIIKRETIKNKSKSKANSP